MSLQVISTSLCDFKFTRSDYGLFRFACRGPLAINSVACGSTSNDELISRSTKQIGAICSWIAMDYREHEIATFGSRTSPHSEPMRTLGLTSVVSWSCQIRKFTGFVSIGRQLTPLLNNNEDGTRKVA